MANNKWSYISLLSLAIIGRFFKTTYKELGDGNIKNVDCVAGSLLIIDSAKFIDSGMYDEKLFLYCEETTLGIRFKKNSTILIFASDSIYPSTFCQHKQKF